MGGTMKPLPRMTPCRGAILLHVPHEETIDESTVWTYRMDIAYGHSVWTYRMDISSQICMLHLRRIARSHQGKGNRMTTRVKEKTLAPSEPEFGQPLVIQDCFLGFW